MWKTLLVLMIGCLFAAQAGFAASYKIDPVHSQVHFTVDHLVVFKVKGEFTDYQGEVVVNSAAKTLEGATANIQVASIDTREQKRDDHLRSADFFDAANHPVMSFVTTKVEGAADSIVVHGNLTIRGQTRPVVLQGRYLGEVTDHYGKQRAGFAASGVINRHDFGLAWSKKLETGGMVVGDEVEIGLEIQAIRR